MNEFLKKLAELLGLGEDATEADVEAALKACTEENKSLKDKAAQLPEADKIVANKAVCELLGLKAGAPADDVSAKIMELKSGNIDGVNVLAELKELKRKNAERDATDAVELALKGGQDYPGTEGMGEGVRSGQPGGLQVLCGESLRRSFLCPKWRAIVWHSRATKSTMRLCSYASSSAYPPRMSRSTERSK